MSISKRQSRIIYDRLVDKYYFVLPDGSDREIYCIQLLDDVDWSYIYMELYKYKLKNNIDEFKCGLKEVLKLIDVYI